MKSVLSSLFCIAFIMLTLGSADACIKKFKRSADVEKLSKDCLKKVGLKEMPSVEELSKPDFNDKCLSKCILGALDMIDEQGQVDPDSFIQYLDDNAPKQLLPKLTEKASACSESKGETARLKEQRKEKLLQNVPQSEASTVASQVLPISSAELHYWIEDYGRNKYWK